VKKNDATAISGTRGGQPGSTQNYFTKDNRSRPGPAEDDRLTAWTQRYLDLAVRGVRSDEVTGKIARHLENLDLQTRPDRRRLHPGVRQQAAVEDRRGVGALPRLLGICQHA